MRPQQGQAKAARASSSQHRPHKAEAGPSGSGINRALLPPQLRGRSNVVTEDVDKLFAKRRSAAAAAEESASKSEAMDMAPADT